MATVDKDGGVSVEGEHVGRIEGLRFQPDKEAEGVHATTIRAASTGPVAAELTQRVEKLYAGNDGDLDFTEQGGIVWDNTVIGRLTAGPDALSPIAKVYGDELLEPTSIERAERRLQQWIDRRIKALFEPLIDLRDDEKIDGIARGVVFQVVEALGVLPRGPIAQDVKSIEQDARAVMRKHGLRFGQYTLFMPAMLKPAPTRLRIVLWGIAQGMDEIPAPPPAGVVTFAAPADAPEAYFQMAGYRKAGDRALRLDMLERLADMTRGLDARKGFEATVDMLSITGLTLEQFAGLMDGLGYRAEKAERPKRKSAPVAPTSMPKAEVDAPAPVDAVISEETPAAATEIALPATREAEADSVPVEAVEAGVTDLDTAVERPSTGSVEDAPEAGAITSGTPEGIEAPAEQLALEPEPLDALEAAPTDVGEPAPVDAVISLDNPADALGDAPAATAFAESDMAAIEVVEQGATDVDQAPERPTGEGDAPIPLVESTEAPLAAMAQPSSVPKEAEGKTVEVAMADVATGDMETFYTFRILPKGRRQRGDGPRRDGENRAPRKEGDRKRQPPREGGKPEGRGNDRKGKGGKPRGKPGHERRDAPKREHAAAPPRSSRPIDPDSPFAILQKLKDGK